MREIKGKTNTSNRVIVANRFRISQRQKKKSFPFQWMRTMNASLYKSQQQQKYHLPSNSLTSTTKTNRFQQFHWLMRRPSLILWNENHGIRHVTNWSIKGKNNNNKNLKHISHKYKDSAFLVLSISLHQYLFEFFKHFGGYSSRHFFAAIFQSLFCNANLNNLVSCH